MQAEVELTDPDSIVSAQPLPAPLSQEAYRFLTKQDLQSIQLAGDLTGKVEVLVPDDIRTPEVVSMARFAKMYLEGHLQALLDIWGNAGTDHE